MSWFRVLDHLPNGRIKLSVTAKVNIWIMTQDNSLWDWPKEYNATNFVNVSPELLVILRLKYREFRF